MQHEEQAWKRLLLLKEFLKKEVTPAQVSLYVDPGNKIGIYNGEPLSADSWLIHTAPEAGQSQQNNKAAVFRVTEKGHCIPESTADSVSPDHVDFIRLYLPLAMAPHFARLCGKPFTIAHLTQSVDGRIATGNGHSKWIGNQEDLCHVHRLRCLCDAVLVGSQTVQLDEPRLTVRHVDGPSPRKVIVGNTACKLDSLLPDSRSELLSFSNRPLYANHPQVREFVFEGEEVNCSDMLHRLLQEGIHSLLIEGGANTVSRFISQQQVDCLQIHIANKLLGSGRAAFALPEIDHIGECLHLQQVAHYRLGDEMLLSAHV